ncbi:acyltransferase family protein [Sphingomonas endophytica]|uniref:acyltransferase family protein n=1 Tax=Sphingomonas endophytica TaxID=869719 RepID=UPI0007367FF2|nr:acyltransferase [Sphingomonas endophytica]
MPNRTDATLPHLDLLRFAAACGVMVLHLGTALSAPARAMLGPIGGLTILVDLFFTISGFVIAHRYAGRLSDVVAIGDFLWRRVVRLAPLHWATLAFYLLIGVAVWSGLATSDDPRRYDPACLIPNALALHALGICHSLSFNGVSWSISAELGMYLLAPLLLFVAVRAPLALVVLALGAAAALDATSGGAWLSWTWYFGVVRALPSFVVGILLARAGDRLRHCPAPRTLAVATTALLLGGVIGGWAPAALLPLAWAVVAATVAADLSARPFTHRTDRLGPISYGIYMLHPVAHTAIVAIIGERLLHLTGTALDLLVVATAMATVPLAHWSLTRFETPLRHRLLRRRPAPLVPLGS